MDVNMPRMNGVEALIIKRKKPSIPIVALSVHDDDELAEAMLHAGAKRM